VSVLYGGVDGGFSAPVPFPTGSSPWKLATGDFNGSDDQANFAKWREQATKN